MLFFLALAVTPFIVLGCPPAGPLAIVITVNLHLVRQRASVRRQQKARRTLARARAEERRQHEMRRAWRSLP
jgi:hypothetical protein